MRLQTQSVIRFESIEGIREFQKKMMKLEQLKYQNTLIFLKTDSVIRLKISVRRERIRELAKLGLTQIEIASEESYDFRCPDGSLEPTKMIDVNNLENLTFQELSLLYLNPVQYIEENSINVDSVDFKIGDCYSKSFASAPLFSVDFNEEDYNTIQIISYALEADEVGMEPEPEGDIVIKEKNAKIANDIIIIIDKVIFFCCCCVLFLGKIIYTNY